MIALLEDHPLAAAFYLDPKRVDALEQSMRAHGWSEHEGAIALYEGKILDGRARYEAALRVGIEPRIDPRALATDDEAALSFIVTRNGARYNESQRALALVRWIRLGAFGRDPAIVAKRVGIKPNLARELLEAPPRPDLVEDGA